MAGTADDTLRKIPSHELTYGRLRDMILFGLLEPGQPVTIQGLIRDLDSGMTPVREAIRRLTAEGALLPQGNRRVAVPQMDGSALEQVAFARLTLEPKLAELALRNLTPALIDQLDEIDSAVDHAIRAGDLPGYLRSNHAFHFALYEAAEAPILLDMARSLWLRFGPSLRVVMQRGGAANLPDRHEEALAAMRAGDTAALALAIQNDIQQGIDQIRLAQAQGTV